MPTLATLLNQEIRRLARKEIRELVGKTKEASSRHRKEIAELKRLVKAQEGRLRFLENQERARVARPEVSKQIVEQARFSPRWLRSHRSKLKFSAEQYAQLVNVSTQSIYQWERGTAKPRKDPLARLVAVRGIGKREALRRLEMLNGKRASASSGTKKKRMTKVGKKKASKRRGRPKKAK